MSTKDLKALLLQNEGRIIACGYLWDIKSKHMAAGIHRVHLSRSIPVAATAEASVVGLPKFENDMRDIVTAVRESEK